MADHDTRDPRGVGTTGHNWDGIEELNNPLPRWWLWTFYGTIVFALVYVILFPAWPLVSGATSGLLGWSTRADAAAEISAVSTAQAPRMAALEKIDMAKLDQDPDLQGFANRAGAALFRANCSQCHGSGAAGAKGYPNLLDDDWLWGGSIRMSPPPSATAFAAPTTRTRAFRRCRPLARFWTRPRSPRWRPMWRRCRRGKTRWPGRAESCSPRIARVAMAIMPRGTATVGAPNLTDAIWLYGGDEATITRTITRGPFGVMPAWGKRLGEAEVRALAAYVHQLGGGEPMPAAAPGAGN